MHGIVDGMVEWRSGNSERDVQDTRLGHCFPYKAIVVVPKKALGRAVNTRYDCISLGRAKLLETQSCGTPYGSRLTAVRDRLVPQYPQIP